MGEIVKATVVQKPFVACPTCGEAGFSIGHLSLFCFGGPASAGPWFCGSCGWGIKLSFAEGAFQVEKLPERQWTSAVKLVIPPQKDPIELIVSGIAWDENEAGGVGVEGRSEHDRYFHEEHTCPVNWLRSVARIKVGDDDDPHGLAKYVSTRVIEPGDKWLKERADDFVAGRDVARAPPVGEPQSGEAAELNDLSAAELAELGELHGPEKCPRGACSDCDGYHHFSDLIVSFANEEAADRLDAGADAEPIHEAEKLGLEIWFPCKHDCGAWRG